ncbi:MAG: hypothetical protein AAF959_10980 [Cyanobacteria bacterium P01_D01_bin.56]
MKTTKPIHPKSLENLNREGRPTVHSEKKKTHNISVTETGWQGIQERAREYGCNSVSEFVEKVGRMELNSFPTPTVMEEVVQRTIEVNLQKLSTEVLGTLSKALPKLIEQGINNALKH